MNVVEKWINILLFTFDFYFITSTIHAACENLLTKIYLAEHFMFLSILMMSNTVPANHNFFEVFLYLFAEFRFEN